MGHESVGLRRGCTSRSESPWVSAYFHCCDWLVGNVVVCITRYTSSRSRLLPTAKTRKRAQRVSATPHLLHPRLSPLIVLNSNARPITATHLLSTQRTPQYIQRSDREEDSRADPGISSIHSCPPSRCNSSTPSPHFILFFVITDHQPLRAKEASVCSCDSATNWG